jgi:hypothetical protein
MTTNRSMVLGALVALVAAVAVSSASACKSRCAETAPAAAASVVAPKPEPAAGPVDAEAVCSVSADEVRVNVPIAVTYGGASTKPASRTLWSFSCNRKTKACEGAHVVLDHLDKGAGIRGGDVVSSLGATLGSSIGAVHVIHYGTRTFTVDAATRKVSYVETTPGGEGHGETACPGL